jgi:ATP-dependent RNA helicase RhlE
MTFDELNLNETLLRAVRAEGYDTPTPIQAKAIPHVLEGRDLLGCAQTGTGKTAAFALPILHRIAAAGRPPKGRRDPRVLVLAPTRELAAQIGESFTAYGQGTGLSTFVIFGGVGQNPQVQALRRGVDILVATPGRLLDLVQQRCVDLRRVEVLVLDEADRMLDMGFIHDVRRILQVVPEKRQSLLFSATMPKEIEALASRILQNPVQVAVTPVATTAEKIDQRVHFVERSDKRALLVHLLEDHAIERALVFTRTKHGANRVVQQLDRAGIRGEAIHGNKSQGARERALKNFKAGTTRLLIATDIAARGIDVDGITHVVNYDLPNEPDTYVHRIGRTARAGASGIALSFCDESERDYLVDIERLIQQRIAVVEDHPYRSTRPAPGPTSLEGGSAPARGGQRSRAGRGGGGGGRGGGGRGGSRGRGAGREGGSGERQASSDGQRAAGGPSRRRRRRGGSGGGGRRNAAPA